MNKYQDGKIYKIINMSNNDMYIGSTYNTLNHRISNHKSAHKRYLKGRGFTYMSVFQILDSECLCDYKVEIIELYPCQNRKELEKREGEIIREYRNNGFNVINQNMPGK
jgi:hypothetical protein